MSSVIEGDGIVAAAVIMPVAIAYGTGWLAWQSGKLLIGANKAINNIIKENVRKHEEAIQNKKMIAESAHNQLVNMCTQILSQIETNMHLYETKEVVTAEQIIHELTSICSERIPEDVQQLESITALGYIKLDRIIQQKKRIGSIKMGDDDEVLYRGTSVADLMDDIRIVVGAMDVSETLGDDIGVEDPKIKERKMLNEEFTAITSMIMNDLKNAEYLSQTYGTTDSINSWFHSCFNGIDKQIEDLCSATISNDELKKGVKRLRAAVEQYEMMAPSIEKELKHFDALYKVYIDASNALHEKVLNRRTFKSASEIEEKLKKLQKRAEKASKCAEIYKKLGHKAYLCYAWDQELRAMGYNVHTRTELTDMVGQRPTHAETKGNRLPFYKWNDNDFTQIYTVASQCDLQLIVSDDGSILMNTIAESENEDIVLEQRNHCAQLQVLHDKLRENWFIDYDYKEIEAPDEIITLAEWRESEGFSTSEDKEKNSIRRTNRKKVENRESIKL